MRKDFVPHAYGQLLIWLQNLSTQWGAYGTSALGMSVADVTAAQALNTQLAAKVQAVLTAQHQLDAALAALDSAKKHPATGFPAVRKLIARAKVALGYTVAIGEAMHAIGGRPVIDETHYQPTLTAKAFAGYVRIRVRKKGVAAMNIYRRLKGETEWRLVVSNRSKFPFDDRTPLAQPGVPELREYSVLGTLANTPIGQRSAIAEVVYAG